MTPSLEPMGKDDCKVVVLYRPDGKGGWLPVCSGVANKRGDLMTAEHCISSLKYAKDRRVAYGEGKPETIISADDFKTVLADVVAKGEPFLKPIIRTSKRFEVHTYALTAFEVDEPLVIGVQLIKRLPISKAKDFVYWLPKDGSGAVLILQPHLQSGVSGSPIIQKYQNHQRVVGIIIGGNQTITIGIGL